MDAHALLHTDPKLVFDLASRIDPPDVVAQRYGLEPQFLAQIASTPHVQRMIEDKRRELEEGGFVLAAKAKLMFEDLLPEVYLRAKSKDATLSGVLDAAKFLRQVAGLDKQDLRTGADERFSITINIPGSQGPVTVTATMDSLPAVAPAHIRSAPVLASDLDYVDA